MSPHLAMPLPHSLELNTNELPVTVSQRKSNFPNEELQGSLYRFFYSYYNYFISHLNCHRIFYSEAHFVAMVRLALILSLSVENT